MKPYDAISAHLNHFVLAEDRVLVRRWLLEFLVSNPHFPVTATAQIGNQLISRWGTDMLRESHGETWSTNPLPATREEWEADGHRVPEGTRPIVLDTMDGCRLELFLLFDVELVDEERVGTIDHTAVADLVQPHELAPTLAEFVPHLGRRERSALSYLWRIGTVLEWAEGSGHAASGWIESSGREHSCWPVPELGRDEACHRIIISRDLEGPAVLHRVLILLARLLGALIQGHREGMSRGSGLVEQVPDTEVAVVSHLVGRRLGLAVPQDTGQLAVPEEIDWSRALETTEVMEDLLQGLANPVFPGAVTPGHTRAAPPVLVRDPYRAIGQELTGNRSAAEQEQVERWLVDFVAGNGRFPLPTALALGWGLYLRWGSIVVGDPSRSSWVGTIELRSVEEWQVRGWVPRPRAQAMVVPSAQGWAVEYLLRDDVVVVDRLAALESAAEPEPENLALFRPGPAAAPALPQFAELIPRREVEMLRNLWRGRIIPCLPDAEGTGPDAPELQGQAHHRLELTPAAGQSPTLAAIEELSRRLFAHDPETGISDTAPEWEIALVTHITARRLGVEYQTCDLVEQALSRGVGAPSLHWGAIFRTAATVESTLSGFSG